MRRVALTIVGLVELTRAQWISNSVEPADWENAINRKRCLHNQFQSVEWREFLYNVSRDAANVNGICSSSDVSYVYLQNSTAATSDTGVTYSGFSFHIEPGVSGRDTAAKVVDAWYSAGLNECSGASGSGLKLPGCVEDDNSTVADTQDTTDTTSDDAQFVFMAMISTSTKYVGCYRCNEGAANASASSSTSLRVICTFKGVSDSCPNISDCSSCHDWEEQSCASEKITVVNSTATEGDCAVSVENLLVTAIPNNETRADDDDELSDEAIALISVAVVLFVLIMIFLYFRWEWIRVHVLGKHSRKYIENKKQAQKANQASLRATQRSVREVQSKRTGASIRHPATDEIFNPQFGLQEAGKSGKSMSALDHLDRRFELRARGSTARRNRGKVTELDSGTGQKYSVMQSSDASVGDATF